MEQSPPSYAHVETRATARFTFEVSLTASPPEAIELFTPEGERKWAEGWDPVYANIPDSRQAGAGTVFTTDAHSVRRVWIVDQYDRNAGVVRYTVFAPGQSVTRIEVRVRAVRGGSIADVTYDRTALSIDADASVEHFALHANEMRNEWQSAIDAIHK